MNPPIELPSPPPLASHQISCASNDCDRKATFVVCSSVNFAVYTPHDLLHTKAVSLNWTDPRIYCFEILGVKSLYRAMIVAQLAERSFLIPEVDCTHPIIAKFDNEHIYC